MSDIIAALKDTIDRAKHGDPEAMVGLRNVLRSVADGADRADLVEIAEAIVCVRNNVARRQAERN
jgi:hypothetical protein